MASKKITNASLDFDDIKANLKAYLKDQDTFSDYDFDGAAMSVLLDVLAYNTHYSALHTNLAINEAFLDSASKRSSVVSKAKELGYVPSSAKCAEAVISINSSQPITILKHSAFTSHTTTSDYVFYTTQEHTLSYISAGNYVAHDVVLRQGTPLKYTYTYALGTKILIPNANVDISTLEVTVSQSTSSSSVVYNNASSMVGLDGNSTIYFVKELENQTYELEFGDGVIGKALELGSIININYFTTSGSIGNNVRAFSYSGPATSATLFVTVTQPSVGGKDLESIQSIKWNAPRSYTAQNRCVTIDDYKNIIYSLYPQAESINVWGGELNNPPSYGDVYISIRPYENERLSDTEKSYILNTILGPRKVVTVHPKLVDPTYIHVQVDTTFHYDPMSATKTSTSLINDVISEIKTYAANNLNRFGSILRYSNLTKTIDDTNPAILSSITTIKLHRDVIPTYNKNVTYTVDIANPIYNSGVPEDSVMSTGFYAMGTAAPVFIADTPTAGSDFGILRMFYYNGSARVYVRNVGTIQYSKGLFTFNGVIITGLAASTFKFIIKPQSNDVVSTRNDIVDIAPTLLTVKAVADRVTDPYVLASSRN